MTILNAELIAVLEKLNGKIDGLDTKINAFIEDTDKNFTYLNHRIDNLEKRMDRLEIRMDSLEMKMDSLETRMDGLEMRMDDLEKKTDALAEDVISKFNYLNDKIDTSAATIHIKLDIISHDVGHIKNWTYSDQNSDMVFKLQKVSRVS